MVEHVKVHNNRKINYMTALKVLSKSRSENPAYKEIFNSFIYDLKKIRNGTRPQLMV